MICPKCGKEINDNIEVCRYCGTRVSVNVNSRGSEALNHLMDNIDTIDVDENGDFVTVPLQGDIDVLATEPLNSNSDCVTVPIQGETDVLVTEPLPENERKNVVAQYNKPIEKPSFEQANKVSNPTNGKSNTPLIVGIIVGVIGIIVAIVAIVALFINMSGNSMVGNGEEPQNQGEDYIIDTNDETYVEEQTDANGETVSATETTKKENDTTKESTETTEETTEKATTPSAPETKAELVAFLNRETAKAAKGSYKVSRTGTIVKPIDVGSATSALNSVIKGVDENASLDSVVGGFLGLNKPINGDIKNGKGEVDAKYMLKAMNLTEADVTSVNVSGNKYTIKIKDCKNPNASSALAHASNDYITFAEVNKSIANEVGSAVKIDEGASVANYKNITFVATIENGKLTNLEYTLSFDASLKMKLAVVTATGTGEAKIYGKYLYINY